jgi:hypothetical protein
MKYLDQITMTLCDLQGNQLPVLIDIYDNSLSRKWLAALNQLIAENYHLEKNYCFLGFPHGPRTLEYICDQINASIYAINTSSVNYHINDHFTVENTIGAEWRLDQSRMNQLHRYFEDLQGHAGAISWYYHQADAAARWHIRQLNLLCHEYESLALSVRKSKTVPEWQRPSQLMCWLQAPRFKLDSDDFELFGVDSINRALGGVYLGVNKAVGKHHWEVFCDEGRDSRVGELVTTSLRCQTLAAGDFDIEWARDPSAYPWQKQQLADFCSWLVANNFDPDDKSLTIGHPKVGQVNLLASFGTTDYDTIWNQLSNYMDVCKISTQSAEATYTYHWSDVDYREQQTRILT